MSHREETLAAGSVLAAFAETLLSGRRVALLGDSSSGLGARLAEASGRRTHVFDPNPQRAGASMAARTGGASVSIAPLEDGFEAHEGAFDAVVVPSLAGLDIADIVAQAAELLSHRGLLLLASPNPERGEGGIGYYDLYDQVAECFEHVSMHGQAPFAGFTVANFAAEGEPTVTIDASLMSGAEEPRVFVALASRQPLTTEPYMLVQVPHRDAEATEDASEVQARLAEVQLRASTLASELEVVGEKARLARQIANERESSNKKLAARVAELQTALEHAGKDALAAERDAKRAVERLERRVKQVEGELQRRPDREGELEEALAAQRAELEDAQQEDLDRMLDRIAELEEALEGAEAKASKAKSAAENAKARADASAQETKAATREMKALRGEVKAAKKDAELAREQAEEQRAQADDARARAAAVAQRLAELERAAEEAREKASKQPTPEPIEEGGATAQQVRGFEFQIVELRKALDEVRAERDEAAGRVKELRREVAETASLKAERDELVAANDALAAQLDGGDIQAEHEREVGSMEERLRERGALVNALRKDLAESERVGRELLGRMLEAASPSNGAPAVSNGSTDEAALVRSQLEALTHRCSRYEADLQAATWKIEALTTEAESGASDHEALEQALQAAHADVAALKRELQARGEQVGEA